MSPRTRILLVVVLAAVAAVAATVGGAVLQGSGDSDARGEQHAATSAAEGLEQPPLELAVADGTRLSRELAAAEAAYERGDLDGARERFAAILAREPDSVEAAVGEALASWPDETLQRLRRVVEREPGSAVARLHLGLVLLADGDRAGAEEQWREAQARDPDTPAALRAESLLHPEIAPGRPTFVSAVAPLDLPADAPLDARLDELRRAAVQDARRGSADGWIRLGAFLQRLGRPVSAQAAYREALAADPDSLDAQVAEAVARFAKDDPSAAFSRLGPLAREHPDAAVVRFHLGLCLLWINQVDEAKRQLELAAAAAPQSVYAVEANRLLARLEPS